MTTRPAQWRFAAAIALALRAARLISDIAIPPHLRWWLIPFDAVTASLITSVMWIVGRPLIAKGPAR